jgi:hypothetical protein
MDQLGNWIRSRFGQLGVIALTRRAGLRQEISPLWRTREGISIGTMSRLDWRSDRYMSHQPKQSRSPDFFNH